MEVTQLHADLVFLLVGLTLGLAVALQATDVPRRAATAGPGAARRWCSPRALVGYAQYATDLPVALVAVHVLGACLVWVAALRLVLGMTTAGGRGRTGTDRAGASRLPRHDLTSPTRLTRRRRRRPPRLRSSTENFAVPPRAPAVHLDPAVAAGRLEPNPGVDHLAAVDVVDLPADRRRRAHRDQPGAAGTGHEAAAGRDAVHGRLGTGGVAGPGGAGAAHPRAGGVPGSGWYRRSDRPRPAAGRRLPRPQGR